MPVALVTGGAGAVGEGIVRRLVSAGHRVAVGHARNAERARRLVKVLSADAHEVMAVRCDVTDRDCISDALAEVGQLWGPPLILVNNGGVRVTKPFKNVRPEEWDEVMQTNFLGAVAATQLALPAMLEAGWGRIVNISSNSGQLPYGLGSTYGASKAALNLMSRVLAVEVARRGVTVNVVLPGVVEGDMTSALKEDDLAAIVNDQAPGRTIEPEEVGALVAFLVSDDARMINGQEIAVDGGGPLLVRSPAR